MFTKPICSFISLAIFATFIALSSCSSPQKLVEQGNYDDVIARTINKLAGKKNKRREHVQALQEAFQKATDGDMRLAARLKAERRSGYWERVYDIYRGVGNRQERVRPLLPLIDEDGVEADFKFVKVDGLVAEARRNAAEDLYRNAGELLAAARQGDKGAAREAFQKLERIERFDRNYKDTRQLQEDAQELGRTYILFKMTNTAPTILPAAFENELLAIGTYDLESRWRSYHARPLNRIQYDYEVVINVTEIEVSPELIREREYEDSKEIEDGFDYVLDERGNVMKDTAGNDIKVVRNSYIKAQVLESFQNKAARVGGRVEIYNLHTRSMLESQRFDAEAVFENYFATFQGDERALSDESKVNCGNGPLPFPPDEVLLLDAAERIKPIIKRKVANSRITS